GVAKPRQVTFAWHRPTDDQPGEAELDLIAQVLAGDEASRLYKLLVDDKQLAQSVRAGQGSQQYSSVFGVTVTLRSDADLATVEQLVEQEVGKIRDTPVSDRELSRAVTNFEAEKVSRLEDLLTRAETLQTY